MPILLGALIAILLFSGGTIVKNKVEEKIEENEIVQSDSFTRWDELFLKYAKKYSVPFIWLKAIAMNESSLGEFPTVAHGLSVPSDREGSKSQDGLSWGLMQVTEKTGRDFDSSCNYYKLNDAEYSINIAAQYLARAKRSFAFISSDFEKYVIMSYNAGVQRVLWEISGEYNNFSKAKFDAHRSAIENATVYYDRYVRNQSIVLSRQTELLG